MIDCLQKQNFGRRHWLFSHQATDKSSGKTSRPTICSSSVKARRTNHLVLASFPSSPPPPPLFLSRSSSPLGSLLTRSSPLALPLPRWQQRRIIQRSHSKNTPALQASFGRLEFIWRRTEKRFSMQRTWNQCWLLPTWLPSKPPPPFILPTKQHSLVSSTPLWVQNTTICSSSVVNIGQF